MVPRFTNLNYIWEGLGSSGIFATGHGKVTPGHPTCSVGGKVTEGGRVNRQMHVMLRPFCPD